MVRIYLFALGCGLRCLLQGSFSDGLKLLVAPVGYWRLCPFALLEREFRACGARRVLDVGSPKLMSIRFADLGAQVIATDLDDDAVRRRWLPTAKTLGLTKYAAAFVDARQLPYPDGSFDLAYSISVMEHIPDNGDGLAIEEMLRVVRPGGKVVVEVPFREKGREIFRNTDSKGAGVAQPMFYERWYDEQTVSERLVSSRPCSKVALGETLAFDPLISGEWKIPKVLRAMIWPLEPLVAMLNFGPDRARPLSIYLVFEKSA